ncbi:GNAT family N-acetyltransferase [Streptomyces sp. O3]
MSLESTPPVPAVPGYVLERSSVRVVEKAARLWESANALREGRSAPETPDPELVSLLRARIGGDGAVFLCARLAGDGEQRMVGMVLGEPSRGDGGRGPAVAGRAHVSFMAVEPSSWGRGLGGALLCGITAALAEAGFDRLGLAVVAGNDRAAGLYRRRGWLPEGPPRRDSRNGLLLQDYMKELVTSAR